MSKFLKQLGKKEILTPHVDRWFERMQPKMNDFTLPYQVVKAEDTHFHPSSHAVGCARSIYSVFDPHLKDEVGRRNYNNKVMANGNLWHALLEHVIVNELGFAKVFELPLWAVRSGDGVIVSDNPPELWEASNWNRWVAHGTLDLPYVHVPGTDERFVVDIKTMNPDSFIAALPPEYLWQKYVAQMQLYLDWTNTERGILFCVQAANPFNFKEIMIDRDRDHARFIYEKWDAVHDSIRSGYPPPHTCADPSSCSSNALYDDEQEGSGR